MPYPRDYNPKEELKKKGENYAGFIKYGLNVQQLNEYEEMPDGALAAFEGTWGGKSIWELWADGKLTQFYLMQWALQQPDAKELGGVVRFVLRIEHLADISAGAVTGAIVDALQSDTGASDVSAARDALPAIHAATRKLPYDSAKFTASLKPVLDAFPGAAITCAGFFSGKDGEPRMQWGFNLCRARHIVSRPKTHVNFAKAAKPLLIGIGGFGLVELCFEDTWGTSFALKRQNMVMVVEKNHSERALLELKIASEVTSPFILDAAYSYIDEKDLVIALRMLPGGDLAHYIKVEKDKAKKEDKPKTGISHAAVQFYIGSTLLGLEILHNHGFVYRDLKDKNVLLDSDGTARLCDFGLVHDLRTGPAKGKVGTKGFWAPEQLVKKEESAYDGACDLWTLGVCAYHWATAVIPFNAPDGDADATNAKTAAADYDKTLPHLVQAGKGEEKKLFRPGLLSLCEALLTIDPKQRLGYKADWQAGNDYLPLKQHAFFKGFDWNALAAGTLPPPIKPKAREINADLPRELKDEFSDWALKDVPAEANDLFKDWTKVNTQVVETNAIEWLDKNPVFFDSQDLRGDALSDKEKVYGSALLKVDLWKSNIGAPAAKAPAGGGKSTSGSKPASGSAHTEAGSAAASGGGCCSLM